MPSSLRDAFHISPTLTLDSGHTICQDLNELAEMAPMVPAPAVEEYLSMILRSAASLGFKGITLIDHIPRTACLGLLPLVPELHAENISVGIDTGQDGIITLKW
jgi:hypothetical protein